jgi:hypothetical protein
MAAAPSEGIGEQSAKVFLSRQHSLVNPNNPHTLQCLICRTGGFSESFFGGIEWLSKLQVWMEKMIRIQKDL